MNEETDVDIFNGGADLQLFYGKLNLYTKNIVIENLKYNTSQFSINLRHNSRNLTKFISFDVNNCYFTLAYRIFSCSHTVYSSSDICTFISCP